MIVKPKHKNIYSCMKDYIPGSYICTYNDFKKVYFEWEPYMKDTVIKIPSLIPSSFHKMYLKYKLDTKNILLLNEFPKYNHQWDELIVSDSCYIKNEI